MTRLLPILLLLLTACASTLAEVRHDAPARIAQLPGTVTALSRCAMDHFEDAGLSFSFHLRDDPARQRTTIAATRQSLFSLIAGLEYRFHQLEPSTVQVEVRTKWPDGGWLSERTWPLLEACARPGS